MHNIINYEYQIPVFYESPYTLYKKQKNKETTQYIIDNLKNSGLYNEKTNNILFNLIKIGKIKTIFENLHNIQNTFNNDNNDNYNNNDNDKNAFLFNKMKNINQHNKLHNSLEYIIHKNKTLVMLDKIYLLLLNKGYTYDFNNYDYVLYEKNTSIQLNNINDIINNNTNDIAKSLYFIKIKYKKNIIIDNKYKNEFEITKIIFIFHNELMFEYFI